MNYTGHLDKEQTASIALTTGDKLTFTPSYPAEIFEIGFVCTVVLASTDALVIKADKRPTAGSDSGRGDGDVGTVTVASADSAGVVAGDVVINRLSAPVEIQSGEQVVMEVTDGVVSGSGVIFINYRQLHRLDRTAKVTVVTA